MQNSTVLELHTFVSNGGHALAGDEALLVLGAKASATLSVAIVAGSVELAAHVYSIVEETYRVVTGGLSHQSDKCDGRKLQPTCQAKKSSMLEPVVTTSCARQRDKTKTIQSQFGAEH